MGLFGELHASWVTIMVVTHEAEVAERGDRTLEIRDGRLFGDSARSSERDEENGER